MILMDITLPESTQIGSPVTTRHQDSLFLPASKNLFISDFPRLATYLLDEYFTYIISHALGRNFVKIIGVAQCAHQFWNWGKLEIS